MTVIWGSQYRGALKLEGLCFHQTFKQVHSSGKEANHCPAWLAPARRIGESSVTLFPHLLQYQRQSKGAGNHALHPAWYWTLWSQSDFLNSIQQIPASMRKIAFQNGITFFMTPKLLRLQTGNNLGNGRVLFHVPSGLKWVWCFLCSFRSNDHVMEFWPHIIQLHDSGMSPVVLCNIGLVLIIGDTSVCAFSKLQVCPALRKLEIASNACLRWMLLHEGASVCTLKIGWLYKITYHKIPLNN